MQACSTHMDVSNLIRLGRDATADKFIGRRINSAALRFLCGLCFVEINTRENNHKT